MYRTILVDDEPIIKKSIAKLIEKKFSHFEIIGEAEDGQEALELTLNSDPDLIITDIRMPEMDGIELIREIHKLNKGTHIVVVSGYNEFDYAKQAIHYNAVDYLLKPVKPQELYLTMERVEEKLQNRDRYKPENRKWLWDCKIYSEEMVEYIWKGRIIDIKSYLTNVHNSLLNNDLDLPVLRQFYIDMLALIRNGLIEKIGDKPVLNRLNVKDIPDSEIVSFIINIFNEIIEFIQESRDWSKYSKVNSALKFIDNQYSDPELNLQVVSREIDMSPTYFSRQFKEEKGISFIQYLTQLRMEKAKDLLEDVTLKTYEVAEMVGYNDYPHFAKTFKKLYQVSPNSYRKLLNNL
ncbi:response regulator transcription factor [Pontibacillus marinus]|uniref:AraC family transcriptional regulator n=1 Tax=Pontibacillus marinus BH030004 = DSM 16465 TaxID=1385511 RepID=A0A0A5G0I9_9BACI|nr:response regulator [Pontibacillus marinus]KGX84570.1 hypothetical protein N783_16665 [Pontibacillus marinus BH030004 = DSM 16465]